METLTGGSFHSKGDGDQGVQGTGKGLIKMKGVYEIQVETNHLITSINTQKRD